MIAVPSSFAETIHCPLCHATRSEYVAEVRTEDLVRLYRRGPNIDVVDELNGVSQFLLFQCLDCKLRHFQPQATGSGSFYASLEPLAGYYKADKPEFHVALANIEPTDTVLEVGCGAGAFASLLPTTACFTGLELNDHAASRARAAGVHVLVETVEDHAKQGHRYDVVVLLQVVEHVADVDGFLVACVQCIKAGGRLIVSVPSAEGFMAVVPNNPLNMPPHHVTWWTDACMRNIANRYGLELHQLEHDRLTPEHEVAYLTHLVRTAIGLRPRRNQLARTSRWFLAVTDAIALSIGRFLSRGLADDRMRPIGHSVTAVYRKG
jgi:2-polyprenyl-3-methyl-5-hydroxy-6-metoxy-1,4-benzoquinol methylase